MSSTGNRDISDTMQHISNGLGYTKALEKYGIFLVGNNKRKRQGLPLRREVVKRKIKRR